METTVECLIWYEC